GDRPLRIAVAGPFLSGPRGMAEAITRLAIEHGVNGRVIFNDASEGGALATLIDEPSPFGERGSAAFNEIELWITRVRDQQPDIVLLDYGSLQPLSEIAKPRQLHAQWTLLRHLHYRSLLIAAGGNNPESSMVTVPAAYPEVLGVGPLADTG